MARVSIGMPVYNGEHYVGQAIDSLLRQTFTDFELIISDNASTDGTQAICREFAARDARIRYHRHDRNRGAAANYNGVFQLSTGEYFKWAAHDDMCAPSYLAECAGVLDSNPSVVLCYPRARIIDETGRPTADYDDGLQCLSHRPSGRLRGYFLIQHVFHPVFGLIRRDVLARTPLIANYVGSDLVLLAHLALAGQIYEIPERLFLRREHPDRSGHLPIRQYSQWWNPAKRGVLYFPRWRWLAEYMKAITVADLPAVERYRCWVELMKWTYWKWPRLMRDLLLRP
jgi:glycosyltransferase involved in cell wall biosynthesis